MTDGIDAGRDHTPAGYRIFDSLTVSHGAAPGPDDGPPAALPPTGAAGVGAAPPAEVSADIGGRDDAGPCPEPAPPIDGYERLTVPQVLKRVDGLSAGELLRVREYEDQHRRRKTLLGRLDRRLAGGPARAA